MATTQDLVRLAALAERNYWRVIAVGDPDQLPPVGRGGMFARWCETVPHHELDAPRRFVQTWEAEASLALRRGDRTIAADYQAHGRLHPADSATLPLQIARVHEDLRAQDKEIAITTTSRSTALAINQEIQRRAHHHEHEPHVPLADGSNAFVGDRIATRRNDRSIEVASGETVRNRQTWEVEQVGPDGGLIVANDRGRAHLPPAYVAEHVELGWAVTGYGNQGDTVDIGIAVVEPGTTRNGMYVAMTRGREENHALLLDAPDAAGVVDAFESALSRGVDQRSALAVTQELHRAAGLTIDPLQLGQTQDLGLGMEL